MGVPIQAGQRHRSRQEGEASQAFAQLVFFKKRIEIFKKGGNIPKVEVFFKKLFFSPELLSECQ
jgi:hypothetical protein